MKAFTEFTTKEIEEHILAAHKEYEEDYKANTKYLDGDHWQDGDGWAGALPAENKSKTLKKIESLFTSQNVMKEIVGRHISGVLSKDPEWSLTLTRALKEDEGPSESEQKLIDETEAALTEWWNDNEVQTVLQEFTKLLLAGKRSVLRLYIPSGFVEGGKISPGEFKEQIDKLRVEVVEPDKGAVVENKDNNQKAGILSFKDQDGNEVFEICYLDENGGTIIKSLGDEESESDPFKLGGNLTMYEGQRDLFLTEQVRQQQKMVNKAHTMMNNNLDSGFLERIFLNAMPPGKWEKQDDGSEEFVPEPLPIGPGTTNFIVGEEVEDDDGRKKLGNASVVLRDPVSNSTFIEAKSEAYASMLEEAHQKHALIAGDATPSGESRIQALADFVTDLESTKSLLDKAGRWLIETVFAMAFDMAGSPNNTEQLRAEFKSRIDPGNIPAELRKQIIEEYKAGMISRETAMVMLGVDDVDAEVAKIDTATQHVEELLEIMNLSGIKPPTLVKKLFRKMIEDKDILADLMESEKELNAIDDEIEQSLDRDAQEQDFLGADGVN